jgi:hypothetical protein
MRARERVSLGVACAVWLGAVGCAHNTAPPGWLPATEAARTLALGGWVTVKTGEQKQDRRTIEGELIAVHPDTLFVLSGDTLVAVDRARTRSVQLTGYAIDLNGMRGWTALGFFGAVSNGWFFALTGPLWIVGGSTATATASHAPEVRYPREPWNRLILYARFPQGLPAGVDRARLER